MALVHRDNQTAPVRVWIDGNPVDRILCVDTTRNVAIQHVRDRRPVMRSKRIGDKLDVQYKLVCRVLSGFIVLTPAHPLSEDAE